jgi:hypothetical protein
LDLKEFKKLNKKFSTRKLDEGVFQSKEYADYIEAFHHNEVIGEWYLKQEIKKSKVKIGRHCCTKMTYYLIFDKKTNEINPDAIIRFNKREKDYGIPIHDGGMSYIKIAFCPWCGTLLTKKRQ